MGTAGLFPARARRGCFNNRSLPDQLLRANPDARLTHTDLVVAPCGWFWKAYAAARVLLPVSANQKTLHRKICSKVPGNCKITMLAMEHEVGLGRDTTWTLRAVVEGVSEAHEVPKHNGAAWKH